MTLSEIRRWLKERNIHLTKSLGQNFLHDPHQLDRIVECADLAPTDRVLEIGPGLGPLTERLMTQAAEVMAIEKDRRLVEVLKERLNVAQASRLSSERAAGVSPAVHTSETAPAPVEPQDHDCVARTSEEMNFRRDAGSTLMETGTPPVLHLLHDDALEWIKREPRDWSDWKVVSNLPYSVGSSILVELCCGIRAPGLMVVTLQLEVVQRLISPPGSKDYGVLTLLVQLDFEPRTHFKISRGCFFPEPDVDSACLVLKRRDSPLLPEALRPAFVRVVKRAFSQRRKMMKNLLRAEWPAELVEAAMTGVGLDPQVRAEVVSLEQFVALTEHLAARPGTACVPADTTVIEPQVPARTPALRVDRQPIRTEEVFDVVNNRDEVIGQATRSEVHARGLLHRAAHVLVFNSRGEIFLQKRSVTKDRSPGLWDSSASGHVDSGEDYPSCALRELREEIGLVPSMPLRRLFKLSASEETDQEHVWVYRCEAEGPFALNPAEIEHGEWFSPQEVSRRIRHDPEGFASAFRHLWSKLPDAQDS